MKTFYVSIYAMLFFISISSVQAQAPVIAWQRTFGGTGNDIMQDIVPTMDGNYIMLGLVDSNNGDVNCNLHSKHDMWVIKMDPSGNIIWQQCYGGYVEEGNPNSKIIQTSDGGYMFQTETWSDDGDVVGHHGKSDAWTVKLDAVGNIEWARSFGGTEWDVPRRILELPGKRYLLMSRSTSADGDVPVNIDLDPQSFDAWIFIVDSAGNILSNHIYGGTGDDDLTDVERLPNGNFAFFGLTSSTDGDLTGMSVDSTDGWLLVTDTAGNIVGNYVFGQQHYESFLDAVPTSDGGFVTFGETTDPTIPVDHGFYHGSVDWWAMKLDQNYNVQWQGIYGGSDKEQLRRSIQTADGTGYYMAGTALSTDGDVQDIPNQLRDWWIVKIALDGTFMWGAVFGGSGVDYPYSITTTGIVVGGTLSSDGDVIGLDGPADGWVIQLDVATGATQVISQPTALNVYPNPVSATLNVKIDGTINGRLEVMNVLGQVVYSGEIIDHLSELDVSGWKAGFYYLRVSASKPPLAGKSFEVIH